MATRAAFIADAVAKIATKYSVAELAVQQYAESFDPNELTASSCAFVTGKMTFEVRRAGQLPAVVGIYFRKNKSADDYWAVDGNDGVTKSLFTTTNTPLVDMVATAIRAKSNATYRWDGRPIYSVLDDEMVVSRGVRVHKAGSEVPTVQFYLHYRNAANPNTLMEQTISEADAQMILKY